jgi:hypothetical protein
MMAKIMDPMECECMLTDYSVSNMNEVLTIALEEHTCLIVPSKHALY